MKIGACLVTRGNVDADVARIVESLPFSDVAVWNNADPRRQDLGVFGRYAAIHELPNDVIYVQDDDCILPPESIAALVAAYQPGAVTANMPAPFRAHYTDSCLVGFGAIFDRDLPMRALGRFALGLGLMPAFDAFEKEPEFFRRTCDVVVTTLTPQVWVDVPYENLDYATAPDRMYRQPEHVGERARMLELARRARDA